MTNLAPVCLFTYNRLYETKKTLEALQTNFLAKESELYIFSDAPKDNSAVEGVSEVRKYLATLTGFKKITIIERDENFGLAMSIITGVTEVINQYGKVVVLEDDLVTSKNFLSFMNQALNFYESNPRIWSISGFSFPITFPESNSYDVTFGLRASSWGWATWLDNWSKVDWDVKNFGEFSADKKAQKRFNQGGSDLCKMLRDQVTGKINSWAIRFCFAQFCHDSYDVYPRISKVQNIGFTDDATNTKGMAKRFATILDDTEMSQFSFAKTPYIDPRILAQFQKTSSVIIRIKYKLLGLFK